MTKCRRCETPIDDDQKICADCFKLGVKILSKDGHRYGNPLPESLQ